MKYLIVPAVLISNLLLPANALAIGPLGEWNRFVQEIRDELREIAPTRAASNGALLRKNLNNRVTIINATLTAKNGTTFMVLKDNKTYTVFTDSNTKFRRRFWGKAALDEIQVNDNLQIYGTWIDTAQTTIQAKLIRDTSIQKRFGVFFGTVQSLTPDGWVMTAIVRGNQTVTVSSTTKFINRKQETITKNDILVGHRVRVKGLWNNTNNTITEVAQAKDFDLPPKPTPAP